MGQYNYWRIKMQKRKLKTQIEGQLVNPQIERVDYFKNYERSLQDRQGLLGKYQVQHKIQKQIQKGSINIEQNDPFNTTIKKITDQIQEKSFNFNRDLQLLKLSLKNGSNSVRAFTPSTDIKKSSRRRKTSEFTHKDIETYRNKQINAAKKLRELKKEKEALKMKRHKEQETKRKQQIENQRLKTEEETQLMDFCKKEKQRKIQQRLKEFSQRKEERRDFLKQSAVKNTRSLPKFKALQQNYKESTQKEQEKKKKHFKDMIKRKFLQYEPQSIKAHEQEYLLHLKQNPNWLHLSRKVKTQEVSPETRQLQEKFRLVGQDPIELQKKRENRQKMKSYQQIVNKIKLKTSLERHLEIQIAKDKAKNPYKYHFLRNKSKQIDDYDIFTRCSKVLITEDPKQLGDRYLNQIKEKNKTSRIKTLGQSSIKRQKTDVLLAPYKNYLPEARQRSKRKQKNQIEQLASKYQKGVAMGMLVQVSEKHRQLAIQKVREWKEELYNYEKSIGTENQIDREFALSIKAKLKCLQIK